MNSAAFLATLQQLPIEKSRQIRRLTGRCSQLQSIIGFALAQSGLRQLGLRSIHLKKIRFINNKPYIPQASHFSISHSKQCICCVISKNQNVGIDVEKNRPLAVSIIKKYALDNSRHTPISVWTQKEAILKVSPNNKLSELKIIQIKNNQSIFKNQAYTVKSFLLDSKYSMSIASTQVITKLKIKRVYF